MIPRASRRPMPSVEALENAQRVAAELAHQAAVAIEVGMTIEEAYLAARHVVAPATRSGSWHSFVVGVDDDLLAYGSVASAIPRFRDRSRVVRRGALAFVDVAPYVDGIPGDYTAVVTVGEERLSELHAGLVSASLEATSHLVSLLRRGCRRVDLLIDAVRNSIDPSRGTTVVDAPITPVGHRIRSTHPVLRAVPEGGVADLFFSTGVAFFRDVPDVLGDAVYVVEPIVHARGAAAKVETMVRVEGDRVDVIEPFRRRTNRPWIEA